MTVQSSACSKRFPLGRICLAGLHWPAIGGDATPLVCVHGWLDNAASFQRLAPLLNQTRAVTSIDLPGHGYSDHRPLGYAYHLLDYVQDLAELIEYLGQPVHIVGHSLGGIVATLYAATKPTKLVSLTLIDSMGPYVASADEFPSRLAKGISKALLSSPKRLSGGKSAAGARSMPRYDSVEAAEQARQSGTLALSAQAARHLVRRNLRPVDGGWSWRTDPRLRRPSLSALTEEQVLASLKAIAVPVLVVQAGDGLFAGSSLLQNRLAALSRATHTRLPGSHHLHLDGDLPLLADTINSFLISTDNS